MRSHDGSGDIEFAFATSHDEVGEITKACFSKHAGWDLAHNTVGYAIRGRLTRAVSWQPGSAGRWTSDSSMQQRLIVYIMSNDTMMTVIDSQAEIANAKNPDARRRLSRDAEATLVNDEGSTHPEAAYLLLELDWLGARVATTTWEVALIPSITA